MKGISSMRQMNWLDTVRRSALYNLHTVHYNLYRVLYRGIPRTCSTVFVFDLVRTVSNTVFLLAREVGVKDNI